jgi:hypothetical protein
MSFLGLSGAITIILLSLGCSGVPGCAMICQGVVLRLVEIILSRKM